MRKLLWGTTLAKGFFLPRISLRSGNDLNVPLVFKRRQFPVRLAYAMTINKSQAQSLQVVGACFLNSQPLSHGQLYVTCSRVTLPHVVGFALCRRLPVMAIDEAYLSCTTLYIQKFLVTESLIQTWQFAIICK
eukprot:comp20018_c0_seq1/m.24565 comp20018_c0_seq1/g.24565  ORF comp20018_c0_seq1/g.24565 comp20018_c0_seq1/m.24565 type:complete len:133 (-) comp20018_c0_seq1:71-469(-)